MEQNNALWNHQRIYLLGWTRFEALAQDLFNKIVAAEFMPDTILCIAKGGLVIGVRFTYLFNTRKFGVLRIEHNATSDIFPKRNLAVLQWSEILGIENSKVLLVDDIVGSGETMKLALDSIREQRPHVIKTASMAININGGWRPDFHIIEVNDWIVFPWEWTDNLSADVNVKALSTVEI